MTTMGLLEWGQTGPGKWVTIYVNSGHTFLEFRLAPPRTASGAPQECAHPASPDPDGSPKTTSAPATWPASRNDTQRALNRQPKTSAPSQIAGADTNPRGDILTAEQVARLLQVRPCTVADWARRGIFPSYKLVSSVATPRKTFQPGSAASAKAGPTRLRDRTGCSRAQDPRVDSSMSPIDRAIRSAIPGCLCQR